LEEVGSNFQRGLGSGSGTQEDGQQLDRGQRGGTKGPEALSGAVELGKDSKRNRHPRTYVVVPITVGPEKRGDGEIAADVNRSARRSGVQASGVVIVSRLTAALVTAAAGGGDQGQPDEHHDQPEADIGQRSIRERHERLPV
jgi:hypothetical protein